MADLATRHALALPEPLFEKLDRRLHGLADTTAIHGKPAHG
jgi:hypothetical protein